MARKRKFIVYVATSADGFIARTDGSVDWLDRPRPKHNYGMSTFYRSIDTCILGRGKPMNSRRSLAWPRVIRARGIMSCRIAGTVTVLNSAVALSSRYGNATRLWTTRRTSTNRFVLLRFGETRDQWSRNLHQRATVFAESHPVCSSEAGWL
jgi:hypothetical protein